MAVSTPYRAIRTPQLRGVLTDRAITVAKSMEKAYKLADGNGLYLLITPRGIKALALEVPVRRQGKVDGGWVIPNLTVGPCEANVLGHLPVLRSWTVGSQPMRPAFRQTWNEQVWISRPAGGVGASGPCTPKPGG